MLADENRNLCRRAFNFAVKRRGVPSDKVATCYNEPLLADLSLFEEFQQQPRNAQSRDPGIHVEIRFGNLRRRRRKYRPR